MIPPFLIRITYLAFTIFFFIISIIHSCVYILFANNLDNTNYYFRAMCISTIIVYIIACISYAGILNQSINRITTNILLYRFQLFNWICVMILFVGFVCEICFLFYVWYLNVIVLYILLTALS